MRWTVAIGATGLLALGIGAGAGFAQTSRADVRGVCNLTALDVYFWPQGHPAIPAIGFPAFAPAHAEFYRARDLRGSAQFGYIDGSQGLLSSTQCTAGTEAKIPFVSDATPQTTTQTQKLRCTLTANADVQIADWTKVTKKTITRLVKVKGKKKKRKVRKTITQTTRIGKLASISMVGGSGAVAEVGISTNPATSSSLKWDSRVCTPVELTG
jgi:hypothetical protein